MNNYIKSNVYCYNILMILYINLFSDNKNFDNEFEKLIKKFEGKTNIKYQTYKFKWIENQVMVEGNDCLRLLRTIKYIDDLVEKKNNITNCIFNIVIDSEPIIERSKHIGFLLKNKELWKEIKDSSIILDYTTAPNAIIFNIDFYTALEYSEETTLKTEFGILNIKVVKCLSNNKEFIVVYKNLDINKRVNVRVHHQCQTSEIFYSIHCDCKKQLDFFMELLYREGNSILIYANEEGRGLGLFNKINAYNLTNETGIDTYNAMKQIAGKSENRSFEIPADILFQMGISKIYLWTNNPLKIEPIKSRRINVIEKRILREGLSPEAKKYMKEKKEHMGHKYDDIT